MKLDCSHKFTFQQLNRIWYPVELNFGRMANEGYDEADAARIKGYILGIVTVLGMGFDNCAELHGSVCNLCRMLKESPDILSRWEIWNREKKGLRDLFAEKLASPELLKTYTPWRNRNEGTSHHVL